MICIVRKDCTTRSLNYGARDYKNFLARSLKKLFAIVKYMIKILQYRVCDKLACAREMVTLYEYIRTYSAYANKQVVRSSILVVPFLDRFHHGKKQNKLKRIKRGRVYQFSIFARNSAFLENLKSVMLERSALISAFV